MYLIKFSKKADKDKKLFKKNKYTAQDSLRSLCSGDL